MQQCVDLKTRKSIIIRHAIPNSRGKKLLKSATDEFALFGFARARVDCIAENAGLNKSLIYHYFGSKEQLYSNELRAAYAKIRNGEKELQLPTWDPEASIRALIRFTFDYYRDNPEFVLLLASENLLQGKFLREIPDIKKLQSPLISQPSTLIDDGIAWGYFNVRIEPVRLYN